MAGLTVGERLGESLRPVFFKVENVLLII